MVMLTVMWRLNHLYFRPLQEITVTDAPTANPLAQAKKSPLDKQINASRSRRSREIKRPCFLSDFDC